MEDDGFLKIDTITNLLSGAVKEKFLECGPFVYGNHPLGLDSRTNYGEFFVKHPTINAPLILEWGEKVYDDGRKYLGQFIFTTNVAEGKGLCVGADGALC